MRKAGSPIVSISLGDSCTFRLGNTINRSGEHQDIELRSGDLFVFGETARVGISRSLKNPSWYSTTRTGDEAGSAKYNDSRDWFKIAATCDQL